MSRRNASLPPTGRLRLAQCVVDDGWPLRRAVTDGDGRVLFCSPSRPGSCADITHARQLGLVGLLTDGPAVEILADAGYQGLGTQTGGRVITPPHRKFKKNGPEACEETHERRRKAHSSRRIRVEHGTASPT